MSRQQKVSTRKAADTETLAGEYQAIMSHGGLSIQSTPRAGNLLVEIEGSFDDIESLAQELYDYWGADKLPDYFDSDEPFILQGWGSDEADVDITSGEWTYAEPDVGIMNSYFTPYSFRLTMSFPSSVNSRESYFKDSSWSDVRNKAVALRKLGAVTILRLDPDVVTAQVIGEHGLYNVALYRQDPNSHSLSSWECDCPWGEWAFKREHQYVGRMCSHAYAVLMEAQSLAMQGQGGKLWQVVDRGETAASVTADKYDLCGNRRDGHCFYPSIAPAGLVVPDGVPGDTIPTRSQSGAWDYYYYDRGPCDFHTRSRQRECPLYQGLVTASKGSRRTSSAHFTREEQRSLIDEPEGKRARNLDDLDVKGTHYEEQDSLNDVVAW